ncbi:hypothetical protein AB0B25_15430 [Nocardia sp. NPDC049190]|uniref:hypothetical protein n=1 Tax=Nocardia sp. NPDC049190 TaxID=3155650 RepID=UPI0033EB56B0
MRLDGTGITTDSPGRYSTANGMVIAARSRNQPTGMRDGESVDCADRGQVVA